MILVKNWKFIVSLFWNKTSQKILFVDILDTKEGFQDHKNVSFYIVEKIRIVLNGVSLWFWSKVGNLLVVPFKQNEPIKSLPW